MRKAIILLAIVVSVATPRAADGRVYYLDSFDGARNNDAVYPTVEQQASRDLDLAFSAGEPIQESENIVPPRRKVYAVVSPEKPYVELSREPDRPTAYYRLTEPAGRRSGYDDVILIPEKYRKLMKLNGGNKGEVILELRVIANHDSA